MPRKCERCSSTMEVGRPRVRVANQLWCQTCTKDQDAPSGRYRPGTDIAKESMTAEDFATGVMTEYHRLLEADMNIKMALTASLTGQRIIVVAHDSGDGQTIYHCPFCGSGQVLARSDKTIECEFCHTSFTVQVQPEYSAFPQTMDGQPVQVPGMPGQIDEPVGGGPADPNAAPMPGEDPNAVPGAEGAATGQDVNQDGVDDGFEETQPAGTDNQPPWLKSGLRTTAGAVLPLDEYMRHLALKHADADVRPTVLRQVRASRGDR